MNWGKAKTILIILFLSANLFLLINILSSASKTDSIMPEIITSTVDILANNGIKIDKSIIPHKNTTLPYAEAENAVKDYDIFSRLVLGDGAKKTENTVYESPAGTISFKGDYFSYSAAKKSTDSSKALTQKDAITISEDFLKQCGINTLSSKSSVQQGTDSYIVTFRDYVNSAPSFNSVVAIKVTNDTVVSMDGSWFNVTQKSGSQNQLKSVTGVLIDFISLPQRTQGEIEINSLSLGYFVPDSDTYHKTAVFTPAWQISLTDGTNYCIDTRNSEQ